MLQVFLGNPSVFSPAQNFTRFDVLVNLIVRNAFVLAGIISFLLLIFGGFSIILGAGSGDTKRMEKGRQTMTGAVVGLIIVVASLWIVQVIEAITGVPLLRPQ